MAKSNREERMRRIMGSGKPTKRPALPDATAPNFLDAVKETLEQVTGKRGEKLDEMVTFRDLENADLSKRMVEQGLDAGAKVKNENLDSSALLQGVDTRDDGLPRPSIPPTISDLVAGAAYTRIILSWTIPLLGNYSYCEVWRANEDNIGNAVLVGTTRSNIYTDVTGGGFTGFYWIRIVNSLNNKGAYSDSANATTPLDFDVIRDAATSRAWQANHAYSIYNAVIPTDKMRYINDEAVVYIAQNGGISGSSEPYWDYVTEFGKTLTDGNITWKAVEAGKIPFMIDAETGLTVIEGAAIRKASIDALTVRDGFFDRMTAAKGTLDEANISIANIFSALISGQIKSDIFEQGIKGFIIKRNGDAEFNDITMRGILLNGTLNPTTKRPDSLARFIDFRKGVFDEHGAETNGNFVLGDVEDNNYISFQYDNNAKKKILRIRGDVLYKDVFAGDDMYLQNENNAVYQTAVMNSYDFEDQIYTDIENDKRIMRASQVFAVGELTLDFYVSLTAENPQISVSSAIGIIPQGSNKVRILKRLCDTYAPKIDFSSKYWNPVAPPEYPINYLKGYYKDMPVWASFRVPDTMTVFGNPYEYSSEINGYVKPDDKREVFFTGFMQGGFWFNNAASFGRFPISVNYGDTIVLLASNSGLKLDYMMDLGQIRCPKFNLLYNKTGENKVIK